mgnify:CR=1 FL=1
MNYYSKTPQQTIASLHSSLHGLSDETAAERLEQYGANTITIAKKPLWKRLLEPFCSVFMGVLFVAAVISLLHQALIDGVIIFVIIAISAIIDYTQQFSTERILRSLQKTVQLQVRVRRDHHEIIIPADALVPGDIILVEEGDKIPADARVIEARSLRVDESQLTGESLPIEKNSNTVPEDAAVYERHNSLYQGSFIISGQATAIIIATGNATEYGKLAALSSRTREASPVQRKIDQLINRIIVAILIIAVLTLGLALWRGMEFSQAVQFVIALSVSAVPEGLPVAISVVIALGMQRIARRKALVRTMAAIETIGVITTIATDKTGTLTKNKLTVQTVWTPHEDESRLQQTLALSTLPHVRGRIYDPLDNAFATYCVQRHIAQPHMTRDITPFQFEHTIAMSGTEHFRAGRYELFIKGAPEVIIKRCHLNHAERKTAEIKLHELTSQGYRVVALAHMTRSKPLSSLEHLPMREKLHFVGLVGVADALRAEARPSIVKAQRAGITVRMITGDHFETAYQIGKQLGLVQQRSEVFDCHHLDDMTDGELAQAVARIRVFSRVVPEQKHRILTALKATEITAMTGDGVNDVPALTNAHVGIAMGSGSEIAKDAGDIILLDNNFRSIISAVREGRTIYSNIKRMVMYLLSTNLGEVLVSIGSLLGGMSVPLLPVQILWVNLVTDTTMVIPLGLEPGQKRTMQRPPHRPHEPLLSRFMLGRVILIALTMALVTLGLYATYNTQYDTGYARTVAFCALVVMQWASAMTARSDYEPVWRRMRCWSLAFYGGLAISITLQLAAMFGSLGALLHVTTIAFHDLLITSTVALVVPLAVIEWHKWLGRRRFAKCIL